MILEIVIKDSKHHLLELSYEYFYCSPFLVRDREVKRREDSNSAQWGATGKNLKKNVKAIQMSLPALMFPWSMKSSGGSSSPDIGKFDGYRR